MNNTIINSIMRNYLKYLCAILLLIGTSARALAADATYYVWDSSTSQWAPYVVQDENLTVVEGPDAPNGKTFIGWHIWNPDEYPYWKVSDYSGYILTNGSAYYSSGSEYATVYVRYCPGTAGNTQQKNIGTNEADNKFYAIYSSGETNWEKNAGWSAGSTDQVTITFNKNGGSGTNYTQKVLKNTPTQLHVCEYNPPASNQRFIGWATTYAHATAGTVDYNDMASITATGDITLWAVWKTFVTITYNLTGLDHNGANPTKLDVGMSSFSANFTYDSGFEGPVSGTVAVGDFYTYTLGSDAEVTFSYMTLTWDGFVVKAGDNIVVTLSATEISCTKLSTPTSLTANPYFDDSGTDKVKCSWSCASDITSHASYLKFSYGLEGQSAINTWSNLLTSYTNWKKPRSELSAGQYWWKVQALGDGTDYCDGDVATGSFCVDDVATSTPSGVTISSITSSSASISWSAMSNATAYAVTIKNNSTSVIVDGYDEYMVESGTSLNVTGLSSGVTYKFEIYAMNACLDFSETYTTTFTTSDIYLITLDKNTSDPGSEDGLAFVDENGTSIYDTDVPIRTHYHVAGYYTDQACTEENKIATDEGALQPSISVSSTPWTNSSSQWVKGGDATFYTKWEGNACEITLNNQSATTPGTRKVTATYGSNTNLNRIGTNPTKTGYKFQGYFTSTGGGGVQLIDENGYWLASKTGYTDASRNWQYDASTLEIYAYWALQEYGNALAWCPEPEIILTGTTYITSLFHTDDGGMVRGSTQLTLTGFNLTAGESVTLTSNNSAVYFSTESTHNIHRTAAAKKPKTSLTFTTDVNGKLNGDVGYTIYVHFMPSAAGDGSISDVTVTATYAVPDPDLVSTTHVYTRSMPAQFVIASKVGSTWYALPADKTDASNPAPVQIEVNESNWTAKGPATVGYAMWPVRTVDSDEAEYTTKGSWLRFAGNGGYGLWANNSSSQYTIKIDASSSAMDNSHVIGAAYMWETTTTPTNAETPTSGTFKYTLQTHQSNNENYLNIKTNDVVWGTYASGYQLTNEMYLLPLTVVTPLEYSVIEWYPTKMLIQTDATISSPTVTVNGEAVASPTVTAKGSKWYEIGNLPLAANPATPITITNSGAACTKTIPIIISRGTKSISETPFTTLGKAVYNLTDLVVRDGAVLTVNGSETDNTFHDVTIHSNSKISVPALNTNSATNKFSVHSLTFFGGIDDIYDGSSYSTDKYGVPELSLKGQFGTKTIGTIDYVMRVDATQMYSLTVPYDVDLADITFWDGSSMGSLGSNLWVSAYDGQARANKEMSNTWIWEADFVSRGLEAKLKQGVGYTISANKQYTGNPYTIIRMPMKSNIGSNATEAAKTVPVAAYANTNSVTITDNHKGWNLVGNPYMATIHGGEPGAQLVVGYLTEHKVDNKWDGTYDWKNDTYRYVTIPFDDGTDYYQEKFSDATLPPFKNFFIQISTGGDLAFTLASRQDAPARFLQVKEREIEFDILLSNDSRKDHTGLLIADQYSPAYEINADLEKMVGSMSVYTIFGGYNLAYNALSPDDAKEWIPVGYVAPTDGEYTFSIDEKSDISEVEHVYLTDYLLNKTVDLIERDYLFSTEKGKNEGRFAINVTLKPEPVDPITTGVDALDVDDNEPIKFIYQDKMYIRHNGVIYDATGKRVREINK